MIDPDGKVRCPRCRGAGVWASDHRGCGADPRCDWCFGRGILTRLERDLFLKEQKDRRLKLQPLLDDQRRRSHG